MLRRPSAACALALLALAIPGSASAAGSGTGGAVVPSDTGGLSYGEPPLRAPRAVAHDFSVVPGTLTPGTEAAFAFRIDGPPGKVRVRIELRRAGAPAPTVRLRLGYVDTGRRVVERWTPAEGELPIGAYRVVLRAWDDRGRPLRRTARASGRTTVTVQVPPPPEGLAPGVFPLDGPYSFGGDDARFGAGRDGHIHQGQDVTAPKGTPVRAPVAGSVYWVAFQAEGAGHYVVIRGLDGRDYVFMHLRRGSILLAQGLPVAAGQVFAQVGNTGSSSGPHLHFEIWPDGWYSSKKSVPIDPLPQLRAWAAAR